MKTILIIITFLCLTSFASADDYKRLENAVKQYEKTGQILNKIKAKGQQLCIEKLEPEVCDKLKIEYNDAIDSYIEAGYLLEEVVIIEGGLTFDNMIVPLDKRTETIDTMGARKTTKTKEELLHDYKAIINKLTVYIIRTNKFLYYMR